MVVQRLIAKPQPVEHVLDLKVRERRVGHADAIPCGVDLRLRLVAVRELPGLRCDPLEELPGEVARTRCTHRALLHRLALRRLAGTAGVTLEILASEQVVAWIRICHVEWLLGNLSQNRGMEAHRREENGLMRRDKDREAKL